MELDPDQDRESLMAALEDYQRGAISLPSFRAAAAAIVERWRDPSASRPEFSASERALWFVVWEIIVGCRESLGRGGASRLQEVLAGRIALPHGGPELRP
jgi:hypothetical protein